MYLEIKLVKGRGIFGKDIESGATFIINDGLSFTGVTKNGEKCSVINPSRVGSLKNKIQDIIIIHGNEVLDNKVLIKPNVIWSVSPIK